jgi:ATP-binding cassette subfamily B protein
MQTLKIYFKASLVQRRNFWLSMFNPLGVVLTNVGVPFFAGRVIAGVSHNSPDVMQYLIAVAICAIAGLACMRVGVINLWTMQAKTMRDLQSRVFMRLLERSAGYHTNQISGKLISDAWEFVGAYGQMISVIVNNGLNFLIVIIIGLIVVFISSWVLGLYVLFVVAVTLIWAYFNSLTRHRLRSKRLAAQKKLISHLSDSIVNVLTVKTFAGEQREIEKERELGETMRELRIRDWSLAVRSGNNRMATLLAMQIVLLFLMIKLGIGNNTNALGASIFAFTYILTITTRLFDINTFTRQFEEGLLQAEPMTKMLQEEIEITDAPGAQPLQIKEGQIDLKDVTFHYQENSKDNHVFKHLDLTVQPGERIGLVGPSGGGKSTLTRLLLRFEDIDSGTIDIDGQNITQVTQASLRNSIAYVPQEPLLFHRSVRENIAYGHPGATSGRN